MVWIVTKSRAFAVLKIKLANSTEAELKSLQSSLRNAKGDIATDLQQNVFKKYVSPCNAFAAAELCALATRSLS